MSDFNLIDESWIPVRLIDGNRLELGIRDVLLRSTEIAVIEDHSPLVVAAMHRFLLAVLYRALEGPTDINGARMYFRTGFPAEKITAYLEKWRDRFWLIDEKYPFGQIPTFEPKIWRAWTALAAEHNADNAKVLFDHVNVGKPGAIFESAAARWIMATQTFSVSCGKSELSHTGTAPSATAAMALPLGRNLQDTLLFSLVPQNQEVAEADLPLWERSPESVEKLKAGSKRTICGFADLYTWRTRSIRLKANGTEGISRLAFASGVGITPTDMIDPMLGYRVDEKQGKLPVQFRERGIWRDFDSLLPDESQLAPKVIDHAIALTRSNRERFPRSVIVLGQSNNKAKIEFWRMERFVLPGAMAGDHSIRSGIHKLLSDAEETQKALRSACALYAGDMLSRGERKPAAEDIRSFIKQMPVIDWYWSTLEARFHEILAEYTPGRDPEDIRWLWLQSVRQALNDSWGRHRASVSPGNAWAIRAVVKADRPIQRKSKELKDEVAKLEPKKEVAWSA